MSSHGGLLSFRSKNFVQYICVVHLCVVCVYVALMGGLSKKPPPPPPQKKIKNKKWSNCCLIRVRKDWKFLENTQKCLAM